MRLVHVVPGIAREASGPSYSVPRLCENLAGRGHAVELSCLAARGPLDGVTLNVHQAWPAAHRLAISPSLARALRAKSLKADIVHNHSLWSMVNIAAGWSVPNRRAKLVTSPRGTLSAWALSRRRHLKQVLWPLQRLALVRADLLHATSETEYKEIRALGLRAPVAVIPNGIDIPEQRRRQRPSASRARTLLFLGRIHPKKGIDRLLQAWRELQDSHADWRLVVAGSSEQGHERDLRQQAAALSLERVTFAGPLYGEDKSRAYFDAQLFVLPTHSENFGMVVAEALAHGCPAVVSRGAPWAGLGAEGCGWWVANDVETLAAALDTAVTLPAEALTEMGDRGRDWMGRDFGWDPIAGRMEAAYRWLLDGGEVPDFIRTA